MNRKHEFYGEADAKVLVDYLNKRDAERKLRAILKEFPDLFDDFLEWFKETNETRLYECAEALKTIPVRNK